MYLARKSREMNNELVLKCLGVEARITHDHHSCPNPRPERFLNELSATNKNKDSKTTLSPPVAAPNARAFSPGLRAGEHDAHSTAVQV